ncbi:MAG: hypothetical protein L3J37_01660 [Rhodobacteraceae bacterium]|nr:hypothetical protein [Paracoccaceae bacterium]
MISHLAIGILAGIGTGWVMSRFFARFCPKNTNNLLLGGLGGALAAYFLAISEKSAVSAPLAGMTRAVAGWDTASVLFAIAISIGAGAFLIMLAGLGRRMLGRS